jgi:hypothetical protein
VQLFKKYSKEKVLNYLLFTWKQLYDSMLTFLFLNLIITSFLVVLSYLKINSFLLNQKFILIVYFVMNILSIIFILIVTVFHSYAYLMYLSFYPLKREIKKIKKKFIVTMFIFFIVFLNIFWFFYRINIDDPIYYIEVLYDYIIKMVLILFLVLSFTVYKAINIIIMINLEEELKKIMTLLFFLKLTTILTIYLAYLGLKTKSIIILTYIILFTPLLITALIKLSKEYEEKIKNLT